MNDILPSRPQEAQRRQRGHTLRGSSLIFLVPFGVARALEPSEEAPRLTDRRGPCRIDLTRWSTLESWSRPPRLHDNNRTYGIQSLHPSKAMSVWCPIEDLSSERTLD